MEDNYIKIYNSSSQLLFLNLFSKMLKHKVVGNYSSLIFLCIGDSGTIGDRLGPQVGTTLSKLLSDECLKNVYIYGNMKNTVNCNNYEHTLENIYSDYLDPLIVAIDAALGEMEHVDTISVSNKNLQPAKGVGKDLPPVGDLSILGYVDYKNNPRLNLNKIPQCNVDKMVNIITHGITDTLYEFKRNNRFYKICGPTNREKVLAGCNTFGKLDSDISEHGLSIKNKL